MMTQEVLNRLLADRALGGLAPDAAALLDAYLEREPAHSELALEIEESVRLARQVLKSAPAVQLPPLKLAALPKRSAAQRHAGRAWWPAQLAAALVLGIGLGFLAFRPGQPARVAADATTVTASVETVDSGSSNAFWSVKRFAQMEPRTASTRGPRVTWNAWLQNSQANN